MMNDDDKEMNKAVTGVVFLIGIPVSYALYRVGLELWCMAYGLFY